MAVSKNSIASPLPHGEGQRAPAWRWRALLLTLVLALALRVAGLLIVGHPEIRRGAIGFGADEPSFHNIAVALAVTGRYDRQPGGAATAFRPPAAILPLAALYYLFGSTPYAAFAYVMLCGLGVVVVVYALAEATFHQRRVAVTAAVVAAVAPTQIFTSSLIWSEPQAVCLTLLLLYLLIQTPRSGQTAYRWLAIGLCAALAYLTRPSAVFVFPFVVGAAVLCGGGRQRLVNLVCVLSMLALPIGLWGLRNRLALGEFITGATVAGEALYGSNNPVTADTSLPAMRTWGPFDLYQEARDGRYRGSWVPMRDIPGWDLPADAPELTVYHRQMESTFAFIRSEPRAWIRLLGYKLVRLVTVEPYAPSVTNDVGTRRVAHRIVTVIEHWFIVGWGAVGTWQLFRARHRARYWYAAFLAAGLVNVLVTYANPRFLLPLTSILIVPAAFALTRAYDAANLRRRVRQIWHIW